MKMKGMKQLKAAVAAGIMALSLFAGSVGAMATGAFSSDDIKVEKVLNVAEGITIPDLKFEFTVSKETDDAPDLKINPISFGSLDMSSVPHKVKSAGITNQDGDLLDGMDFPHAGSFEYTIEEKNSGEQTTDIEDDVLTYSAVSYTLKIDVKNLSPDTPGGPEREISGIRIIGEDGRKAQKIVFENTYTKNGNTGGEYALEIEKKTEGDYADLTKKFDFCITLTKSPTEPESVEKCSGTILREDGAKEDMPFWYGTETEFQLAHGDKLVFETLPAGTKYVVTEKGETDGYVPSVSVKENGLQKPKIAGTDGNDLSSAESERTNLVGENENKVVFTNTYDETPVTGIQLSQIPFLIMAGICVAGIVVYVTVRRKLTR